MGRVPAARRLSGHERKGAKRAECSRPDSKSQYAWEAERLGEIETSCKLRASYRASKGHDSVMAAGKV